jgi:hypothetical protein
MSPTTPKTQAEKFAAEYADSAGDEMLATVKKVGKKAGNITKIALGVSMPHQIGFLVGLAPLAWHTPQQILQSMTVISGSILVPVVVDLMITLCVQVLAARATTAAARKLALRLIIVPVLLSATVNVIAPGPAILRGVFGAIVLFIPMAEALRAALKPDFAQLEKAETEILAQVAKPPVEGRKCPEGCTCGKHTRKAKAAPKTRAPRKATAARRPAQASIDTVIGALPAAPVSPAPAGLRTTSGLVIARTMDEAIA